MNVTTALSNNFSTVTFPVYFLDFLDSVSVLKAPVVSIEFIILL